ncbi:putative anthocyanidin 3-O-glucosyltransferase [Helianthus debilis subsp. tardiflorus]
MKKLELVFIPLAASSHLVTSPQTDLDPLTKSIVSSNDRIRFTIIPPAITNHFSLFTSSSISLEMLANMVFESHKPQVEQVVMDLVSNGSTQLVGFVLDMFSSCMIDVANKFKVPSYIFFPFNTAFLGFLLHLPVRHNQVGINFHPSDPDSVIPSFQNPVPANVLPGAVFDKRGGYFNESQLEQMAIALERSGHRFLWSIRQPPAKDSVGTTSDYTNIKKVLPDGFLERVKERGMVCGWAPQLEVLAHGAVKGFVTHCGWNSILESLWYNVPIATWPLNAEQQLNAFLLVRELELAVELSLSYRSSVSGLVMADQIERAIYSLMDDLNPVRENVKDISEKGRNAMIKGGSSFGTLEKLVQDMVTKHGE